jgi:hypothetical protein
MKIRITENELKYIIRQTMNEATGVEEKFPPGFIQKKGKQWAIDYMTKKHPELDPAGFFVVGDAIRSNGKLRPKSAPKPKAPVISKPDEMSDEEYEQKLVIPNNEKFREKLAQYDDEEFRPIINGGRYFGGKADYGCDYEVSNRGRLKVLNHSNALKSNIYDPYPAPGKKAMQFTMIANGENDERMRTTPSVAYMVANAFLGEHDPSQFIVVHKDGDWRNNNVENLEWVPSNKTWKFRGGNGGGASVPQAMQEAITKAILKSLRNL